MTNAKHTPGNWKPSDNGLGVWSGSEPLGKNKIIATFDAVARSPEENRVNAARAIHCVNQHEQLVDELENTIFELEQWMEVFPSGSDNTPDVLKKARAVVRKARAA